MGGGTLTFESLTSFAGTLTKKGLPPPTIQRTYDKEMFGMEIQKGPDELQDEYKARIRWICDGLTTRFDAVLIETGMDRNARIFQVQKAYRPHLQ